MSSVERLRRMNGAAQGHVTHIDRTRERDERSRDAAGEPDCGGEEYSGKYNNIDQVSR